MWILVLDGLVLQVVVSHEGLLVRDRLFGVLGLEQAVFDCALQVQAHVFLHGHHFATVNWCSLFLILKLLVL